MFFLLKVSFCSFLGAFLNLFWQNDSKFYFEKKPKGAYKTNQDLFEISRRLV